MTAKKPGRPEPAHPTPEYSGYRKYAVTLMAALVLIVLSPAVENWKDEPTDSFPLSYYPMFSFRRGPTKTEHYFLGIDRDGTRRPIDVSYVFPGGMNQGRKQLRRSVEMGPETVEALARILARTMERSNRPEHANLALVHVAAGRYVLDDYFHGNKIPSGSDPWPAAR